MGLVIKQTAPDFEAETTQGGIRFCHWKAPRPSIRIVRQAR
jgi:hypothetical protein